ncbi:hypothetical protein [Paenibacillus agaridevorans]|uniref:hypothetical protein n=1 Tax=Paenibacillus agaridevorans TaxID=171404 RepID=UPI001FE84F04|nr:hypothetical protein [Paenibacillus agaridevorans]
MSIRFRLLLSFSSVVLLSVVLFVAAAYLLSVAVTGDFRSIGSFYRIHYSLHPLSGEEENIFLELKYLAKHDPGQLRDPELLESYDMTLKMVYSLSYKGKQSFEIDSNHDLLVLNNVRQVTADTIEAVSSREDGIIDYGYIISAYAGGRGANAAILDEENRLNGKPMSIISSLATRKATLTPEAGEPIEVSYVGFTQSTDGKQEPKFRLPQGQTLKSGVRYTLTSDWFELKENEFVASEFQPLTIASAEAQDEKTLLVTCRKIPAMNCSLTDPSN